MIFHIVFIFQGVKFLLFPPFSAIPPFFLLFRQNVLIVLLFTSVLGLCPLKCTFLGNFGCGCFQMAGYMGQSLLQGAKPQPCSCPQVASGEACLTALGPCSPSLGGGIGKLGKPRVHTMAVWLWGMWYVVCLVLKARSLAFSAIHTTYLHTI